MKRQRGRSRRPNNNNSNRSLESTGPDVKIRGTAQQIYDKYMQYNRDRASSGDRVAAEAYLQHAEHYYRLLMQNDGFRQRMLQKIAEEQNELDEDGDDGDDIEDEMEVEAADDNESEDAEPDPPRKRDPLAVVDMDEGDAEATARDDDEDEGREARKAGRSGRRKRYPRRADRDDDRTGLDRMIGGEDKATADA